MRFHSVIALAIFLLGILTVPTQAADLRGTWSGEAVILLQKGEEIVKVPRVMTLVIVEFDGTLIRGYRTWRALTDDPVNPGALRGLLAKAEKFGCLIENAALALMLAGMIVLAGTQIFQDIFDRQHHPLAGQFGMATAGADIIIGGHEQLYLRVRTDHRADVTPVQNRTTVAGRERALKIQQRLTHLGDRGHAAGGLRHLGRAQIVGLQILGCQRAGGTNRVSAIQRAPPGRAIK